MYPISFVVTTHSNRTENLNQTIRFLVKREPIVKLSQLIVVCQDSIEYTNSDFASFSLINLNLPHFNKPIMCNTAANMAKGNIIVFLDCDRILPENWFTKRAANLEPGTVASVHRLYRLSVSATDMQIEEGIVPKLPDYRIADMSTISKNLGAKTVMSGNAMMKLDDYLDLGGMDESFEGYGYSDTDLSYKLYKAGFHIELTNHDELHLWHNIDIPLEEFATSNLNNALKFCKKWNLAPPLWWGKLRKLYYGKTF
jgi:GT2 family glycosyltransferase